MTTALGAFNAIRARLEANAPTYAGQPVPLRWQNENGDPIPDVPAPFIYLEFLAYDGQLASFGSGRTANRYRNYATIEAYVFVPRGWGVSDALTIAEQVGAAFRSYRDTDISCFDATVYPGGSGASIKPPGMDSEVGNYDYAAAQISLFYDQIG